MGSIETQLIVNSTKRNVGPPVYVSRGKIYRTEYSRTSALQYVLKNVIDLTCNLYPQRWTSRWRRSTWSLTTSCPRPWPRFSSQSMFTKRYCPASICLADANRSWVGSKHSRWMPIFQDWCQSFQIYAYRSRSMPISSSWAKWNTWNFVIETAGFVVMLISLRHPKFPSCL